MNIVMINNSWIPSGGASIVALGLVHELRRRGHQVRLWSSSGDGGSKALNCRGTTRLAQMLIRLGLHRDQAQALSYGLPFHPDVAWADVIHCHNLHKGYFSLPVLRLLSDRKPIVWTLHDFDAVWGGCDVPMGCDKWRNGCLPCPQRQSSHLSGPGSSPPRGLHLRRKVRQSSRVTYVPVSHWMERELLKDPAMRSAQLHTVPNGVDVELFHPRAKRTREELGLPVGRPLVACLASNPKAYWIAFDLAFEAFRMLAEQEQIIPILVGRHSQELLSRCELPCPAIALGAVSDRCKLAAVYCAVDTVVVPSCAEAFGLIASEAMACGTPVATFAGTAVAEQIIDGETGCLAPEFSASDLADAIRRTLALKQSLPDLAQRCRTHVESNYSLELSVARYEALYNELVS